MTQPTDTPDVWTIADRAAAGENVPYPQVARLAEALLAMRPAPDPALDATEALAHAAIEWAGPRRWSVSEPFLRGGDGPTRELHDVLASSRPRMTAAENCPAAIAAFIAAADPVGVLALIARVRRRAQPVTATTLDQLEALADDETTCQLSGAFVRELVKLARAGMAAPAETHRAALTGLLEHAEQRLEDADRPHKVDAARDEIAALRAVLGEDGGPQR